MRYYGEQRSERDQKCALCGCWISEERVCVVKGCMLVCEKCHKQISGCGPSVIAHQSADWLVEKRGKSHDEAAGLRKPSPSCRCEIRLREGEE